MLKEQPPKGNSCIYPGGCVVADLHISTILNNGEIARLAQEKARLNDPDIDTVNDLRISQLSEENKQLVSQIKRNACSTCHFKR